MTRIPVDLEKNFPAPSPRVASKFRSKPNAWLSDFLNLSTLIFISTKSDNGQLNISPRGGEPGFVQLQDRALIFTEDPGNHLFESCRATVQSAGVGVIAIVPGLTEIVRIRGEASLSQTAPKGQPTIEWSVSIHEWYYHCGRALKKSGIFDLTRHTDHEDMKQHLRRYTRDSDAYQSSEADE